MKVQLKYTQQFSKNFPKQTVVQSIEINQANMFFKSYHFAQFMRIPAWQIMAAITLLLIILEEKKKEFP